MRSVFFVGASIMAMAISQPAYAQDAAATQDDPAQADDTAAPAPEPTTAAPAQSGDDIVVTGTRASLQLNYGLLGSRSLGGARQMLATIHPDNPYLDPAIAKMFGTLSNGFDAALGTSGTAAAPAQAIYVGTQNINNMPAGNYSRSLLCQTVGMPCNVNNRALMRAVFASGTV